MKTFIYVNPILFGEPIELGHLDVPLDEMDNALDALECELTYNL